MARNEGRMQQKIFALTVPWCALLFSDWLWQEACKRGCTSALHTQRIRFVVVYVARRRAPELAHADVAQPDGVSPDILGGKPLCPGRSGAFPSRPATGPEFVADAESVPAVGDLLILLTDSFVSPCVCSRCANVRPIALKANRLARKP